MYTKTHEEYSIAVARPGTSPEALGMRPLQAHCHLGLGTLYATTGQLQQAQAALATASEMYRAIAMTLWLPHTEATLAPITRCSSFFALTDFARHEPKQNQRIVRD